MCSYTVLLRICREDPTLMSSHADLLPVVECLLTTVYVLMSREQLKKNCFFPHQNTTVELQSRF